MSSTDEELIEKARAFLKDDIEKLTNINQVLDLPCSCLKEVSKGIGQKLGEKMGINFIKELAEVDVDKQEEIIEHCGCTTFEVEKWVLAARIVSRLSKLEVTSAKKIVLIGLDNAGKTAVRETLKHKYVMDGAQFNQKMKDIQPTKGVVREVISVFNNEIQLWDMGGQKLYRDNYLREPEKYLLNFSAVIYLIDIQDEKKYDAAIGYLNQLVTTFRSLNENPLFIICFHKFDPDIQDLEKHSETIETLWLNISKILNTNQFTFKRYTTSIYDDLALFRFFSEVIESVTQPDIGEMINLILSEGAHEVGLDNLILFGENGVLLGKYFENDGIASKLYDQLYLISTQTLVSFTHMNNLLKEKKQLRSLSYSFFTVDRANFLMTRAVFLDQSIYFAAMDSTKTVLDEKFIMGLLPWLSNLFT